MIRLSQSLDSERMQQLAAFIRQQPGVTGVGRETGGEMTVSFDGGDDAATALLRQLCQQAPVVDFHRAPLNLEKVFMEVTKDE